MKDGRFNYGGNCVIRLNIVRARIFDLIFASHHRWQRMRDTCCERDDTQINHPVLSISGFTMGQLLCFQVIEIFWERTFKLEN